MGCYRRKYVILFKKLKMNLFYFYYKIKMLQIPKNDLININELIDNNDEIGIIGTTNTGKSTTLIYDIYKKNPDKIIFILERTVIATLNLYRFMKLSFKKKNLNTNHIGYAANNKIRYYNKIISNNGNENTRIVYCTDKHFDNLMIRWLSGEIDKFCDFIVLDECDTPILTYDVTMSGLKRLSESGRSIPKLLLISATLDLKKTIFENIPTYSLIGKTYKVDKYYHNRDFLITDHSIIKEIAKVAIERYDNIKIRGVSFLIICSGGKEVEEVSEEIYNLMDYRDITINKLYSALPKQELENVTEYPNEDEIKMIVCTNIAESSLTLPNVIGVIDSMKRKIIQISDSGEIELIEGYETKASAKQRAGRAGRTQDGFCYRMCTEEGFNTLEESETNEILRVPIESLILRLRNIDIDPYIFLKELIIKYDQLAINISNSLKELIRLRLIKETTLKVTEMGKFCTKLPIVLRYSIFLYKWFEEDKPKGLGIFFTSILNEYRKSFFEYQRTSTYDEFIRSTIENHNQFYSHFHHNTDIGTTLNIWKEFMSTVVKKYGFNIPEDVIILFSNYYRLNKTMMINTVKTIQSLHNILSNDNEFFYGDFDVDNVLKVMIPILYDILDDNKFIIENSSNRVITYKKIGKENEKYLFEKFPAISGEFKEHRQVLALATGEHTKNGITTKKIYLIAPMYYGKIKKTQNHEIPDDF